MRSSFTAFFVVFLSLAAWGCGPGDDYEEGSGDNGPGDNGDNGDNGPGDNGGDTQECVTPCGDRQTCIDGECVDLPDSCPCPPESYCDLSTNTCVAGCTTDEHCSPGRICQPNRTCRDGCRDDDWCAAGHICDDTDLVCREGCRDDEVCLDGEICDPRSLTCRDGCRDDEDCAPGQMCDDENFCADGCETSATCPSGQVCDDGLCVPRVCQPNSTVCVDDIAMTCNDVGSGYLPDSTDCGAEQKQCHEGRCVIFYEGFVDGNIDEWKSTHMTRTCDFSLSSIASPADPNSLSIERTPSETRIRRSLGIAGSHPDQPSYISYWFRIDSEQSLHFSVCFGRWDSSWSTMDVAVCILVANYTGRIMDGIYSDYEHIGDRVVGQWHHIEMELDWDNGWAKISIDGEVATSFRSFNTNHRVRDIIIELSSLHDILPLTPGTVLVDGFLLE